MKVSTVLRQALAVFRKHWKALMLTLLLQLVLLGIALVPLLFLAAPQIKALALLSVPLYLLIVLPARQNVALAMQDMLSGGSLYTPQLISTEDYGRKLLRGLITALRLLLWCVPLIAGVAVALWATRGNVDAFTVYRSIMAFGGGDSFRGIQLLVIIYLLLLVPVVLGCAFHSGARHAAALGDPQLTKGRHGALIRLWLGGLAALVPFLVAAAIPCAWYFRALADAVRVFFSTFEFTLPNPGAAIIVLIVLVVVLLLPAVPLRTLLPAIYLRAAKDGDDHDAA